MDPRIEKLSLLFSPGETGCRIFFLPETASTNLLALEMPSADVCHGAVVVAGKQTCGRGRQGRDWFSLENKGLFLTIILIVDEYLAKIIPLCSLVSALAIYDCLEDAGCGNIDIKWPNDVLVDGKKISGILGEMKTGPLGIERIALGMSVNVTHAFEDFPQELAEQSTSITIATGIEHESEEILLSLLKSHNNWFRFLRSGGEEALLREIEKRSSWARGKEICFLSQTGMEQEGVTRGLGHGGCLLVELSSGEEIFLHAGDVHLKKKPAS